MQFELTIIRGMKVALLAGTVYVAYELASASERLSCPVERLPSVMLYAAFVSLLMLAIYAKFDFLKNGIFEKSVAPVRIVFAATIILEVGWFVILGVRNFGCSSILRVLPLCATLVIGYTSFGFSLLFGDKFLGVLRKIVRLGISVSR